MAALFGPEGALDRVGDGTLCLVGRGRMPPAVQARVMAQVQAGPPFRLIATSGLRMAEKLAAGGFRADLY